MKIYKDVTELIGGTPLMELCNFEKNNSCVATIAAKIEAFNPAGSTKDRAALYMINDAEKKGLLKKGCTIVEPTSGNTGIGLASVCATRGYKLILTMPESMSIERRKLLKAYGAEIVLTDAKEGMAGSKHKAEEICSQTDGAIILGQFDNRANPQAHFETTGPEIWRDTDGKVDIFVAAVGTGGTLTGTGEFLKSKNPDIKVVAVEPKASPLLSGGKAGPHKIQGIGANFVPSILNREVIDEIITISNEDALYTGNEIAKTEGILVGISSGAAVAAARELANREENKGKLIVAVLVDTGERYLSSEMYDG